MSPAVVNPARSVGSRGRHFGANHSQSIANSSAQNEAPDRLDAAIKSASVKRQAKSSSHKFEAPLVAALSPLQAGQRQPSARQLCAPQHEHDEHSGLARRLSRVLQKSLSAYYTSTPGDACQPRLTKYSASLRRASRMLDNDYDGQQWKRKSQKRATKAPKDDDIEKQKQQQQQHDFNVDAGYAWIILVVIFFMNASTYGTARAYGLIFERLVRDGVHTRTMAAMPFTLMGACENMAGPLSGYLLSRSPNKSWRLMVFVGSALLALGHFFAALTVCSAPGQLLSLGLMCGLGLSFVTISFFQINNAYFVRYRSSAFGIGLTGAAFGTFYISPLCQHYLDNAGIASSYLMLGLILLPNVPLALLLKPKQCAKSARAQQADLVTVSEIVDQQQQTDRIRIRASIKRVLKNPMFHLIWPTQLLFCWFNFVFGMIIVDLGRDRGLTDAHLGRLMPVWAAGQLAGRLVLGPMVDMKYCSYKTWTVLCFGFTGLVMLAMNNTSKQMGQFYAQDTLSIMMLVLVFVLSMFIALLYILLNGLVVVYVEQQLQPLCIGISSFVGSFLLLPRANVIGYYRDTIGEYDSMISLFSWVSMGASVMWLLAPSVGYRLKRLYRNRWSSLEESCMSKEVKSATCCKKLLNLTAAGLKAPLLSDLLSNLNCLDGSSHAKL